MREIKFKAKTLDGNQWIFGALVWDEYEKLKRYYILEDSAVEFDMFEQVHPETLSQFTGFKDVDGNDAYENDTIEQNEPITFRDGCFFSGHIPLALVIEHRKITGNIHD